MAARDGTVPYGRFDRVSLRRHGAAGRRSGSAPKRIPFFLLALFALVLLGGCASWDTEMPDNDAAGTDKLKRSPCACAELDYRPGSYEWLG